MQERDIFEHFSGVMPDKRFFTLSSASDSQQCITDKRSLGALRRTTIPGTRLYDFRVSPHILVGCLCADPGKLNVQYTEYFTEYRRMKRNY